MAQLGTHFTFFTHPFKIFFSTTSDPLRSSSIDVLYTKSWWSKAFVTSPRPTVGHSKSLDWLESDLYKPDVMGQFITSEMGHWFSDAYPSVELHNAIEEVRFSMRPRDLKSRYPAFLRAIKESVRLAFRSLPMSLTRQICRNYQKINIYMMFTWQSFGLTWANSSRYIARTGPWFLLSSPSWVIHSLRVNCLGAWLQLIALYHRNGNILTESKDSTYTVIMIHTMMNGICRSLDLLWRKSFPTLLRQVICTHRPLHFSWSPIATI